MYTPSALRPMTVDEYDTWTPGLIEEYAAEKVRAGNWPAGGAVERSKKEHDEMLPGGVNTPNHHFFSIVDPKAGPTGPGVGILWINVRTAGGTHPPEAREAFIYNIEVKPKWRGRGLGAAAMRELESWCRSHGIIAIKLHVFGHNTTAQRLYQHLGYETTNINMCRRLD